MAKSNAMYPYPVLIIRDIQEQHLNVDTFPAAEFFTTTREVRLSVYQDASKPWDWARLQRLASQCYPVHGEIEIEHQGEFYSPRDAVAPKAKAPAAKVLQQAIRNYLAGTITRDELVLLAA